MTSKATPIASERAAPEDGSLARVSALLSPEAGADSIAPIDEQVLDATRELVSLHGTRTTIDEIAERAGVARATVFRRFGSKDAVLEQMFAREVRVVFQGLSAAAAAAPDPVLGVVEFFAGALRLALTHPVARRYAQGEYRALMRMRKQDPPPIRIIAFKFAEVIEHARTRGAVDDAVDAGVIGDVLAHTVVAYQLFPDGSVDLADEQAVREFAAAVVTPLLSAPTRPDKH